MHNKGNLTEQTHRTFEEEIRKLEKSQDKSKFTEDSDIEGFENDSKPVVVISKSAKRADKAARRTLTYYKNSGVRSFGQEKSKRVIQIFENDNEERPVSTCRVIHQGKL